ncbi:hypothetical protein RRG08_040768 [Elysia crispata]|uniref:Uncharacterized protein n=1 Tax=Elysia crispata TaxID=231223 RepID=A0AAE1BFU3_9GAST|nr:hypothetical protein RRG08_040768 [Elysia crispata]
MVDAIDYVQNIVGQHEPASFGEFNITFPFERVRPWVRLKLESQRCCICEAHQKLLSLLHDTLSSFLKASCLGLEPKIAVQRLLTPILTSSPQLSSPENSHLQEA